MTTHLRLAKALAQAGLCSRREAEAWITAGRVHLNGYLQTSPAINVNLGEDTILVDGMPLPAPQQKIQVFAYYKPPGVICTAHDPQGRKTVFDALPKKLPRLILVGRLDLNSEGLLLLTTDGTFAGELMHPKNKLERVYKVRFRGDITPEIEKEMAQGLTIEGVHYQPFNLKKKTTKAQPSANHWVELTLKEGKNREIRKVFEYFGLQVNRLIRLNYGGVGLEGLLPSAWRKLTEKEINTLKSQLKAIDFS